MEAGCFVCFVLDVSLVPRAVPDMQGARILKKKKKKSYLAFIVQKPRGPASLS